MTAHTFLQHHNQGCAADKDCACEHLKTPPGTLTVSGIERVWLINGELVKETAPYHALDREAVGESPNPKKES